MCRNNNCKLKLKCYRYTAIPDKIYQSYSDFKPDDTGKCEYFYNNKYNNNRVIVKIKDISYTI